MDNGGVRDSWRDACEKIEANQQSMQLDYKWEIQKYLKRIELLFKAGYGINDENLARLRLLEEKLVQEGVER